MKKYIVVYPNRDYGKLMWKDIEELPNVEIIRTPLFQNKKINNMLFRIHFSFKLNNIFDIPLKNIWEKKYILSSFEFNSNDEYVMIFTDPSLCNYTESYLNKIKKKGKIKMVLLLINSFYRMEKIVKPMLSCFDFIYTYDYSEAKIFGFKYYPTVYSRINVKNNYNDNIDCFFVGVAKDRLKKLIFVYDQLTAKGLKCEFFISGVKKKDRVYRSGIIYNKWIDYNTVLEKSCSSKSIIEIMDKNNAGVTLRTLEAICYNKLLITNNEKLKNNYFYNNKFMYIFDDEVKISKEFLEGITNVDYKYDGRYSPKLFLKMLDKTTS